MSISLISDNYAAANTVALSSGSTGDICVVFAYRSGSTTAPTIPGTFTTVTNSAGANTNSRAIGYRVLQAGDNLSTIVGTWTNATAINANVLRGQAASPIGASASGGTNTSTLTTPALTLNVADGTSWVLAFAGSKATNANTVTLSSTTDEGSSQGALNFATGQGSTSWASRNYSTTVNASANRMDAVELLNLASNLTRTTSDSISSLSDSPSRDAMSVARSTADSLSSLTEAVTRLLVVMARSTSDSLSTIADAVSRAITTGRSTSDTVSSISDSPSRIGSISRASSASLASITEVAARTFVGAHSITDSLPSLGDSVTRTASTIRAIGDSINSLTAAVVGIVMGGGQTFVRAVVDVVDAISDEIQRALSIHRLTEDAVDVVSEIVSRGIGLVRGLADSIASIIEVFHQIFPRPRGKMKSSISASAIRSAVTIRRRRQ